MINEAGGKFGREETMSEISSMRDFQRDIKKNEGVEIEQGFLVKTFNNCIERNSHLLGMLGNPFKLFCFIEVIAKAPGFQEIYWGGNGSKEERAASASNLANLEEI